MRLAAALPLAAAAASAADPPSKFKVDQSSLPGLAHPGRGGVPSIWTGYINAGPPPAANGSAEPYGDMMFHYFMIESEGDVSRDPVIIWYNGGPGASSLFGVLQEFGPLLVDVRSYDDLYNRTGVPTLQHNPFAWTRRATIVAIDQPPPIGFSYCTKAGVKGNGTSCGDWSDKRSFAANHQAHRAFFTKVWPELAKNPVYIAGESYGGIYVPGYAEAMLDDPIPGLNFKGFVVGDGLMGCEPVPGKPVNWCVGLDNVEFFKYPNALPGPWWDIHFMQGHNMISEGLFHRFMSTCTEAELRTPDYSAACQVLVDEMAQQVGGWFVYDPYNDCAGGAFGTAKYGAMAAIRARKRAAGRVAPAAPAHPISGWPGPSAGGGAPCSGDALGDYLGNPSVQRALGAVDGSTFLNCDNAHCFTYVPDQLRVTPIYTRAVEAGLRVLIYGGSDDACGLGPTPAQEIVVPAFDRDLGNQTEAWRPWTTDGRVRMGGYVMAWRGGAAQFAVVRGAGHLVPTNRPEPAFTLISAFLDGTPLPRYAP